MKFDLVGICVIATLIITIVEIRKEINMIYKETERTKNKMKKEDLINVFKQAKENKNGICVELMIPGQNTTEKIFNDYEALDTKLKYYLEAYDDNLIHNKNSQIKIVKSYCMDFYSEL